MKENNRLVKYRISRGKINQKLWNEGWAASKIGSFLGFYLIRYTNFRFSYYKDNPENR